MKKKNNKSNKNSSSLSFAAYQYKDRFIDEYFLEFLEKYDTNLFNRTIVLEGSLASFSADDDSSVSGVGKIVSFSKFDKAMTILEDIDNKKPITIKLLSDGGDPSTGLAIAGRIRGSQCKVIIEGYGEIASAATIIFVSGHKRKMSELSSFIYHETFLTIDKHSEYPNKNISSVLDFYKNQYKLEILWAKHMAKFTKKNEKWWLNKIKSGKDLFLLPDDCLKMGITDEIINIK